MLKLLCTEPDHPDECVMIDGVHTSEVDLEAVPCDHPDPPAGWVPPVPGLCWGCGEPATPSYTDWGIPANRPARVRQAMIEQAGRAHHYRWRMTAACGFIHTDFDGDVQAFADWMLAP